MRNPHIPLERYLDGLDVLAQYDQSVIDSLSIPINIGNVHRYTKEQLSYLSVDDLIKICEVRKIYRGEDFLVGTPPRDVLELIILNNQRIPIIFGSPSPQYAQQYLLLGKAEAYRDRTIRFPMIAVNRLSIDPDNSRFSFPVRRIIGWSESKREVAQSGQPVPVVMTYQVDIMSSKITQMNQIDMALRRIFGVNHTRFTVEHGSPWGKLPVFVRAEQSYQDDSTLEADAEQAEKILRHVYTITVDGWIPREVMMVKTVWSVAFSLGEMTKQNILEELTRSLTVPEPEPEFISAFIDGGFFEEEFIE